MTVQTAAPASDLLWSLEEALETTGRTAAGRRDPFRLFHPALESWLAVLDDGHRGSSSARRGPPASSPGAHAPS